MLKDPHQLSEEISRYQSAGVDKETFLRLQNDLRTFEEHTEDTARNHSLHGDNLDDDTLQIAAKFYVINRCSFSGTALSGGFSPRAAAERFTASSVQRVEQFSNDLISVRDDGFTTAFDRYQNLGVDFLFLDPPYHMGRTKDKLYGDRGSFHQGFDHTLLRDMVVDSGISFLLTYNDAPVIRELYSDYHIVNVNWSYGMNASKKSDEIVISDHCIDLPT